VTDSQPSAGSSNDRLRNWTLAGIKLLVSVAAFWIVLGTIDFQSLLEQFSRADPMWMFVGFVALMIHFALVIWRWDYVLSRSYGLRLGARRLSLVFGFGEVLGPALPSFVGMDVVRTLALTGSAPLGTIAKAVTIDRVIGLLALLVMIALSIPGFALLVSDGPAVWVLVLFGIGGLAAYVVGLQAEPIIARLPAIGDGLASLLRDLRKVSYDVRAISVLVLSGLAVHVSSVAIFWAAALMLHGSLDFVSCLLIVPTAMLVASVPISVGGWGVREGALVAGFALIGANPENVVAASICFGLSGLVSGAIGIVGSPLLPGGAMVEEKTI
jgi:glycosyltransferase 2 family protein